jgi:hypothetical protein
MKILVLVQSTELKLYAPLLKAQEETWNSVPHPEVDVVYYQASKNFDKLNGNILSITSIDHVEYMFKIFMKSIRHLRNQSWDYIVKTDHSVYLNKEKLYELIASKPRQDYYGGVPLKINVEKEGEIIPQYFMWGECFILSRDLAMYLLDKFNKAPLKGKFPEDIVVGQLLNNKGIWDGSINIYNPLSDEDIPVDLPIYRVRLTNSISPILSLPPDMDMIIEGDVTMMHNIHKTITNGQTNNHSILQEQDKN